MSAIPFTLPLNSAQFTSALHKGQGRALMHVRKVGLADLEHFILDACLHDRAYDPQCECDRTGWLMEIVDASGAETHIAQTLIPQLDDPTAEFWDATQRSRIARRLASRGHLEARRRLYACLRKRPDCMNVIGAEDIVALDGADGLVYVAEYLGKLLQEEPDSWFDDDPLRQFDDAQGTGAGRRVLDTAAAQSQFVATYLRHLDERGQAKKTTSTTPPSGGYLSPGNVLLDASGPRSHIERMQRISAADVIREIETEDPQRNRYWFMSWGRHAPEDGLFAVFNSMLAQSEPGRLFKYLRVFGRRALPAFDPRLLRYANHDSTEVRNIAHTALSNYAHPEVRRLGIECLSAGRIFESELKLLEKNYQLADAAIIERALQVPPDRDQLHGLVFDLVELFRSNQVAESAKAMLFAYEESPCSNCRCKAVNILVNTGNAPDWLLEECRHDSSDEIRAIPPPKEPSP